MDQVQMLITQIVGLSWIRCVMEEGYNFVNKETGRVEGDEQIIFNNFQMQTGLFDLPAAKGSPLGLQKNLLEVVGNYVVNGDERTKKILFSPEFARAAKDKIRQIKERRY